MLLGIFNGLKRAFLCILGKIKIYPWPMFVIYSPRGYDIRADRIRLAMRLARKGDVFVRRYKNYLDGFFIPGRFTHSGIYIGAGKIVHAMSDGVQKIDIIDFLRCDGFAIIRPSPREDSVGEEIAKKAADIACSYIGCEYDFDFKIECGEVDKKGPVYCHELVRKCYPDLDIPVVKPSLWNGMIRIGRGTYLAQSFFESPDMEVVYDSDFSEPK